MNFLEGIEPGWLWLIGGVVLLIAEIIAPGLFLLFIGAAAMATGVFTILFDLGVAPQLALFALYAVIALMVGRKVYANRDVNSADPLLNDRSARLVGKVVTVVTPVDEHDGRGRIRILPVGTCARRRGRKHALVMFGEYVSVGGERSADERLTEEM